MFFYVPNSKTSNYILINFVSLSPMKCASINMQPTVHNEELLKVSVVMCTYNGEDFIREQLDSIVQQTYPIYELIIQDDGSTDKTVDIIQQYAQQYTYIKFYHNEGKHGINSNFFSAMARATGDVIAISDQDDIWVPQKNEWQVKALGDNWLVAGQSKPFTTDDTPISFDDRLPNIHLLRMIHVGMIPGHVQLFRRELLTYLPKESAFMYDLQISVVAACMGKITYLPKVLVNQRRHVTAATYTQPINNERSLSNMFRYASRSMHLYRKARPLIRSTFGQWIAFFNEIPVQNARTEEAVRMSKLQTGHSFWCWCKLTIFCMQHSAHLFHATEPNRLLSILRGAFFPISCATYYRDLIKK